MKIILRTLRRREGDAVAASIVVIGDVQRLVQIAHKMNEKLQRQNAFRRRRGRAFELGRKLGRFCSLRNPVPDLGSPIAEEAS